jgi:transcriptional regulator with XRE-family HTH domain
MKTLRQLIKLNNKILVEVSKDTGIHIATLSKFQTGKQKPSKLQRSILEKYFGEPFEYISDLEMERTARLVTEERVAELEKINKDLWSMYSEAVDKLRKIEQISKGY